MKKLVCDRCGKELTEKDGIDLAFEGKWAWANSVRARGSEPRGIIPCENFIHCGGEMILVSERKVFRGARWLPKLFSSTKET